MSDEKEGPVEDKELWKQRALKLLIYHGLPLAMFLLVAFMIHRNLLLYDGVIVIDDLTRPSDPSKWMDTFYPGWDPSMSVSVMARATQLFLFLPFLLFGQIFGLSTSKVLGLNFIFVSFLAGASMFYASRYFLIKSYGKDRFTSFVPALLGIAYMWNAYMLFQSFHPYIRAGFAMAPLVVLSLYKGLETSKLRWIVCAAAIWSIACGDLHWVAYGGILFSSIVIFHWVQDMVASSDAKTRFKRSMFHVAVFAVLFGSVMILSMHWLLPGVLMGSTSRYGWLITSDQLVSWYEASTLSLLFQRQAFHFKTETFFDVYEPISRHPFMMGLVALLGFTSVVSALVALVLKPKNGYVVFFGIFFLISMFITGIPNFAPDLGVWIIMEAPLHGLYGWAFRTPKSAQLIFISVCFLMGFTFLEVLRRTNRSKVVPEGAKKWVSLGIVSLILVAILVPVWPLATGDASGDLRPMDLPPEFDEANAWLAQQDGDFKVLWEPTYHTADVTWNGDKRTIKDLPAMDSSRDTYVFYTPNEQPNRYGIHYLQASTRLNSDSFLYANTSNDLGKVLAPMGIKYVLVHDDIEGDAERIDTIIANLDHQQDLIHVKSFGFIRIYENLEYGGDRVPRAFTASNTWMSYGGVEVVPQLCSIDEFSPLDNAVVFADQQRYDQRQVNDCTGVVTTSKTHPDAIALTFADEKWFYTPFDHIDAYAPNEKWSKIRFVDVKTTREHNWGDLNAWDWEYGTGSVVTWGENPIDPDRTDDGDLVLSLDLEDEVHFTSRADGLDLVASPLTGYSGKALIGTIEKGPDDVEVLGSTQRMEIGDVSNDLRCTFRFSTVNINNGQLIIKYFDDTGRFLRRDYVFTMSGDNVPANYTYDLEIPSDTTSVKLELVCEHNPIGDSMWVINDLKLYDVSHFVEPIRSVIPLDLSSSGEHDIFVRCNMGSRGGRLRIGIDDEGPWTVETTAALGGYRWVLLGTQDLSRGSHDLIIDSLEGFNAINMLAVVPSDEMEVLRQTANEYLDERDHVILLEGEGQGQYGNVLKNRGGDVSGGQSLLIEDSMTAVFTFETTISASRSVSVRMRAIGPHQRASVSYGNRTVELSGPGMMSYQLEPSWFPAGEHMVNITTYHEDELVGEHGLDSAGHGYNSSKKDYSSSISTTDKVDGNGSLMITTNTSKGLRFSRHEGPEFDIEPGVDHEISISAKTFNVNNSHAKLMGYDSSTSSWTPLFRVMPSVRGENGWTTYSMSLNVEMNITKIKVQLMAGTVLDPSKGNATTWYDGIKLFKDLPGGSCEIDQIVIGTGELEDLFTPSDGSSVISYRKISNTKFEIKMVCDGPIMLGFAESYEDHWRARMDGKSIRPTPIFGMINGFSISEAGNHTIVIEYLPQQWLDIGLVITLAAGSSMILLLIAVERKRIISRIETMTGRFTDGKG